jgi:putative oxidoreductase
VKSFLLGSQEVVLLVVRLGLAAVMVLHGWRHLADPGVSAQVERLTQAGLFEPKIMTWAAIVLELGGGVLLALGALTRLVAAAFVAEFVMTILWLHWSQGFFASQGGWEYAGVLALVGLVLVAYGGGAVSIDRLFRRPGPAGSTR